MRKFLCFALLFCALFSWGQNRSVAKKVQNLDAKSQSFTHFDLFTKNTEAERSAKYVQSASDVTVLNLNSTELKRIVADAPNYISLSIPYQNENIEVELFQETVFTEGFVATDENGNVLNYTPGKYYRGVVDGDYTSLVAISFFEDDVIGVISNNVHGNIVVGKSVDKADFVTYAEKNLLGNNPFQCGVDELEYNRQIAEDLSFDPSVHKAPDTEKCVKIYYEIAYRPYQQNGSNIQNTLNWITAIQNNIGTLYSNDDINVALHSVKIWTTMDPYNGSYIQNLEMFRNTVSGFNGDLAHLVNYPSTTSVAYLDSLCGTYRYAYSGISMSFAQVPTYSWTIMAMTHEMGHALGSQHTHACAWNGNNTQIDGCGPISGNPDPNNGNCANGPLPNNGGTIMSYCHLLGSVGINFNNGFGPQPGALIRSTIESKPCLSTDCSCMSTIQDVALTHLENGDVQAVISDWGSTQWKYRVYPFGTPNENWITTTNPTILITGFTGNQNYSLEFMNLCSSNVEGGIIKKVIVVGDFCDGTLFTDTGGETNSYESNQNYTKTFYPSSTGAKVSIHFERFNAQANRDFMYVYNGDSTSSPLFQNGTLTGYQNPGPTFTSTDDSGAITIKFTSDGVGNAFGWEAVLNCDALGIEDISDSHGLAVYPNPTTDILNISTQKGRIQALKLTDVSGKLIHTENVNYSNGTLKIGHLPKGVYILSIKVNDKEVVKKIIKK
jgi:hypothetical protein